MKSIIFNTEMVRAILAERKTVARLAVFPSKDLREFPMKGCPNGWWFQGRVYRTWDNAMNNPQGVMSLCRYRLGDILYVRETWCKTDCFGLQDGYVYKANDNSILEHTGFTPKWCPSIHMP